MPNLEIFKAANGKYRTKLLFWEVWSDLAISERAIEPIFTLHKDKEGLINFGKAYIATRDPTGYKVSQEVLGGDYTLWTVLLNCRWFKNAKEIWDRELDAMIKSEALDEIRALAKEGLPAQRLAAAKYLANLEYRKDRLAQKGRPRREDVDKAARELANNERELLEDLGRIRLVSNG
jgi:hypothetical protein